ncbi:MAG: ATP-binding protein [Planctomycetota bacterium]
MTGPEGPLSAKDMSTTPANQFARATFFAPAGRDTAQEVRRVADAVEDVPLLRQVLEAMPVAAMVLNSHRQIVVANRALLQLPANLLGQLVLHDLIQLRPGEAIGCVNAQDGPDGCGTSRNCSVCGAAQAIVQCQELGEPVARECRVIVQTPGGPMPLDLRVTASPLAHRDQQLVILAIEDISQSKRLAVLQRAFFHDVLNTAGCIGGWVQWLARTNTLNTNVVEKLTVLAAQLIEEIGAHRELMCAESGDLHVSCEPVLPAEVLEELRAHWCVHDLASERAINVGEASHTMVLTDGHLLKRVLTNMIKNALEATAPGGPVTLEAIDRGPEVVFSVHNGEVMPDDVQMQVFQRSFTTKGEKGRGIGTHSMKLLGERYLGGKVSFVSRRPDGTTFCLTLPKTPRVATV